MSEPSDRGPREREPDEGRPQYTRYRSRPEILSRLRRGEGPSLGGLGTLRAERAERRSRERRRSLRPHGPLRARRVIGWIVAALVGWVVLSLVLFLVSAQIESGKIPDGVDAALDGAGPVGLSTQTILVLGSDARSASFNDTGGRITGPQTGRSDSILLLRVGPGHAGRLSIPRDTVVDIPGHGRDKINAANAIGGPALAITTIKQYLGIPINHLVEVDFTNFPRLIDALGGVDVETGCVRAELSGGDANGGVTLDLDPGTHHFDGRHALAYARMRKNACNAADSDITRAKHQQQVFAAIKSKALSPGTFVRLPWVAWSAPKAIRSDMSGPSLLGLFAALELGGSPAPNVLQPSGYETLPNGGDAVVVSDAEKRAAVQRFLGH